MAHKPEHCGDVMYPFDVLFGWVGTEDGVTLHPSGNVDAIDYEPTGHTEVIWDMQRTIGYGCRSCGKVVLLPGFETLFDLGLGDLT